MKSTVKVDASSIVGEIDPKVYGHFIENMARCVYGGLLRNERPGRVSGPWRLRGDLVRLVRRLNPSVVRWPGGLYADGYDWRDGVGPTDARPLKRNRYWSRFGSFTRILDPNVFGSHEFMEFVGAVGAEPYINVNLGTGTAAEAAEWVEYMNSPAHTLEGARRASYGREEPFGVRFWGLGNEIYGFWSYGHSGPRDYARKYLEFKRAMEDVDTDLRFVAVGADPYFSKRWNRVVLAEAGDEIDLLSVHIYLPGPERFLGVLGTRMLRGASGLYAAIVSAPLEFERRLKVAADDIRSVMGGGKAPRIALDEWNIWWNLHQVLVPRWRLREALFVCGMFHVFHRMSDHVGMANIAQLVNVLGVLSTSGDRVYRSAIYYPFEMYTNLGGPLRVACEVDCGSYRSPRAGGIPPMGAVPVLDCSGTLSADGRRLTLFAVNRDPDDGVEVDIELSGFRPAGRAGLHRLGGPSIDAYNRYGDDETVCISIQDIDTGDVLPRCILPAHSATALVLDSAG